MTIQTGVRLVVLFTLTFFGAPARSQPTSTEKKPPTQPDTIDIHGDNPTDPTRQPGEASGNPATPAPDDSAGMPQHEALAEPSDAPAADPPPPTRPKRRLVQRRPLPFRQGTVTLGGGLGLGFSGDTFRFSLGANAGYFVLPGVEPGLYADIVVSSGLPTVVSVLPYLRWIIHRSYRFSPFIRIRGGGVFVLDTANLGSFGGGAGVIVGLSRLVALTAEGLIERWFPDDQCGPGGVVSTGTIDGCTRFGFSLSLGLFFR